MPIVMAVKTQKVRLVKSLESPEREAVFCIVDV